MLQTKFQNLISSIPLRSQIAIVFALVLGLLGIFVPLVYLHLTVQDSSNITKYYVVSRRDLFQLLDIFNCSSYIKGIELPPYWLSDSLWNTLIRTFPVMVVMQYFKNYTSKKTRNIMFASILLGLVLVVALDILSTPARISCGEGWQVTIHAYSFSWLSILVPLISLLLGIYAIQKHKVTVMTKTQ